MKLPLDESKWTSRFRYLEVGRYSAAKNGLFREKKNGQPILLELSEIEDYRTQHDNLGIYTSVFQYDGTDLDRASRLGNLYFDLDSPGGDEALKDAQALVDYLQKHISDQAIRVYFTGQKGFHIECEAIALGISPGKNLAAHFRYIAAQLVEILNLTTVDFAVYDTRRMWRLPGSIHQASGLYKRELTKKDLFHWDIDQIRNLAKVPGLSVVPDQKFEAKANEWYREWSYRKETQEISADTRIARFQKHGTNLVYKEDPNSELEFNPDLFDKCPAILRLWEQAETTHDLPHEARLFLCSLLTYSNEAEYYLHQILSNCADYLPSKTQAHISDWKRRRELGIGGRPYTCQRANSVGVGCGNCELEPKERLERTGEGSLLKTGEIAPPSPLRFAYSRRKKQG